MTVSTTESNQQFVGDNLIAVFAVTYVVLEATDLEVYLDNVIQVTGFTTLLNPDQESAPGADVTFDDAPATDAIINIVRNVPATQLVDYQPFDAFPSETHEGALDKLTMLVQQLQEIQARSPIPPPTIPVGGGGAEVAYGRVNTQNGVVDTDNGFFTAANVITGQCDVTFNTPQTDADYVVNATAYNNIGGIVLTIQTKTINGFTINSFDVTGGRINSTVFITCTSTSRPFV